MAGQCQLAPAARAQHADHKSNVLPKRSRGQEKIIDNFEETPDVHEVSEDQV